MLDIPTEENTMTFTKFAVAAAAALLCAGSVIAAPVEGTDYVVLEKPIPNASGTFIKVYSYDCPFCYKYDKSVVPAVKAKLDKEMKFLDYHLHTKGKYGKEGSEVLAVMWVADEAAGRDPYAADAMHKKAKFALYKAYHDKKQRWDDGADAFRATALEAVGMSKADFDAKKNDPKVQALVKAWADSTYDVAKIQGVPVLNVNDLANALKQAVLPGEELRIFLAKEGKEQGQAIGYLDDGTMVVVENGKRSVNQTVPVTVTSVLQTSAGRMIFAKMK